MKSRDLGRDGLCLHSEYGCKYACQWVFPGLGWRVNDTSEQSSEGRGVEPTLSVVGAGRAACQQVDGRKLRTPRCLLVCFQGCLTRCFRANMSKTELLIFQHKPAPHTVPFPQVME